MKNLLPLLACFVALIACNNQNCANNVNDTNSSGNIEAVYNEQTTPIVADTLDADTTEAKAPESLNDIRFDGWGKAEWVDNEYIRTVRKYLDAYNNGEITDTVLDEYKDDIQGKFIIGDIQPWMLGGAIIHIVFYDHPEKLFYSVVYSYVDEQTREVYDYECRGIRLETAECGISQDEIEEFLKDCPEHRMW
jgi:hypothetical protein